MSEITAEPLPDADEAAPDVSVYQAEPVPIGSLRAHPRNYRRHPDDQIEHLMQSMREHGFYRNVVIARDGTILAGHGVVEAATRLGLDAVAAIRLDLDPLDPKALKILAGDNELVKLAEVDDRALSELLADIRDTDLDGLLGTGFDNQMLANLVFVTRPASEIATQDESALWAGMPEFEKNEMDGYRLMVHFDTPEERLAFVEEVGIPPIKKMARVWAAWWPPRERDDLSSVRFEDGTEEQSKDQAAASG